MMGRIRGVLYYNSVSDREMSFGLARETMNRPPSIATKSSQSKFEIWLAQGLYEPSAGLIAGETTDDSADHSQPSTNVSRLSTAKRNACAREATCHEAADKSWRSSAVRSIRQLIKHYFCDGQHAQNYYCRKRADERQWPRKFEPTQVHSPRDCDRRRKRNPAKSPIRNANNSVIYTQPF